MRKFLTLVALLFLPLCAFGQTADDIIAKYVEARGGLAQIKAVQSERVTGSIVFAPNVQGAFVVERERPMKMHMEITLSGMMMIRTYDGKSSGWTYNPSGDNPAVMPMTETDLRNILDEADFEGPFVDYKSKGNHVELAGKTTVEGKPAYKIKLTNKNGDVSYFSFDANSYMLLRFQGTLKRENKDLATESFFRDFREVAGLQYPFVIESVSPDTGDTQKILADKIEVNVAIPESHFAKPSTPPAAPPPAAAPAVPAEAPKPN
jgi:outer membrane lipoprotein-sorting protein